MSKSRLEAFSDGVIAILITIMVLEFKTPHDPTFAALAGLAPLFAVYVLSFVYLGIYWANHHHLFHAATRISGGVLWANLHLLFWLSLVPFVTWWMAEHCTAAVPTAVYAAVLLCDAVAWTLMKNALVRLEGPDSRVGRAVGRDVKGRVSLALYIAAIALAFVRPWIAQALVAVVALMWLVPDRRIEAVLAEPALR
ncbi:MAG TPA: TMEM175 family protein [Vicinamibacterales bacterium]|nr:TMEM175 family protein [Vicinamibacterales bacterium]